MLECRLGSGLRSPLVFFLIAVLAMPLAPPAGTAEQRIDLDGNPLNGKESTVQTNVLQSFPVEVENIIFNNAGGAGFTFEWPGAGPGGFQSLLTSGPDVGTKWTWTTVSQVYSITSTGMFRVDPREVPVYGTGMAGISTPGIGGGAFDLPGKSIFPTEVTVSSASLTSSLVTFFSPQQTIASCDSTFVPGRFEQRITNTTGETVTFMVEEPDCCPEADMTICEDGCQFYLTDENNCGGCGNVCEWDQTCEQGVCEDICPGVGQQLCGETCEDTLNDVNNCGGCGNVCAFDEFCDNGACADICPGPGQEYCDEVCVDTFNDDGNCGDCNVVCAFDEFCSGGSCGPICPGVGQAYCNEVCVDTLTDENNCGSCGTVCAFDEFCDGGACADICPGVGQEYCNGVCVDTLTDESNCGACDTVCAFDEFCDGGACADICPGVGQEYCNSVCVDTLTDVGNCGACNNACAFDQFCDNGACADICPGATSQLCDGISCADLLTDPLNCGACGNVCDANSICTGGACVECRPPLQTNCNNECVNIHTDPFNCGECGFVCDFTDCPSTGTGTCSQGSSCVCDPPEGNAAEEYAFSPVFEPPDEVVAMPAQRLSKRVFAQSRPTFPDPVPRLSPVTESAHPRVTRRERPGPTRTEQNVPPRVERTREAESGARGSSVIAAPVCGVPPIQVEIPDGESFTLCQTGSPIGREIFTTATVMKGSRKVGQGPCALIVPATGATIGEFEPSPVSVILADDSGDSLLQPGETAQARVEVLNVGSGALLNAVATMSCEPDGFNPHPVTFLADSVTFDDFPALDTPADCDSTPVFDPKTTNGSFMFTIPDEQESDVGRVCKLNIQGDGPSGLVSTDMPFVLGIADKCDLQNLSDTPYDGLEGFLSPVIVDLVPKSYPYNTAAATINHGSNAPLKMRLKCGDQTLGKDDIADRPQIVSIRHVDIGELPLTNIKDSASNPDDPNFDCKTNLCEFGLRTIGFPAGTIVISVQLADSRVFHAAVTTVE